MDWLNQNWYVVVVVLVLLFGIYYTITNKEKVKEWLKYAVTIAEAELGSGTGQLKLRAKRLGIVGKNLFILTETELDKTLAQIEKVKPDVIIVDSIQTMNSDKI